MPILMLWSKTNSVLLLLLLIGKSPTLCKVSVHPAVTYTLNVLLLWQWRAPPPTCLLAINIPVGLSVGSAIQGNGQMPNSSGRIKKIWKLLDHLNALGFMGWTVTIVIKLKWLSISTFITISRLLEVFLFLLFHLWRDRGSAGLGD